MAAWSEKCAGTKGPPSLTISEHWNYEDRKDFFGGYCWMAQGPLPIEWATIQTSARGLWGEALRREMQHYNHQVGLKMVGEMLPDERNRVTLADEKDQYGLKVARITYSWGENDKRLIQHALNEMQESLEARGCQPSVPARGRYQSSRRHRAHGIRRRDERGQCRLPVLGYPQSMDLRWLGIPDHRRGQSLAHHPGDRAAHCGSHQGTRRTRRVA